MKKALLVSAFYLENSTSRPYHMKMYFESIGYQTTVLTTNFNHSSKKHEVIDSPDVIQLKVPSYSQTFSFKRILSHIIYAIKIKKYIKLGKYDLLYIAVPPNYSSFIASKYAKKMQKTIVTDIIDIWPQNNGRFPVSIILKKWSNMRNKTVRISDLVLIETNGYQKYISSIRSDFELVYLTKTVDENLANENLENFDLSIDFKIGYLGNFSDSYDFNSLIEIAKLLNKNYKVTLELVGDGYLKKAFINDLDKNFIQYNDYGIIFDEAKKKQIFQACHFGYNAVNRDVTVGLSYKSIDYLSYGLPLLNSIGHDTKVLIDSYNAGINFISSVDAFEQIMNLSNNSYKDMRVGAKTLFIKCFSIIAFNTRMNEVLKKKGGIS